MSNTAYIIIIIASLVVASGVIAYVGDVLGSYIGKKRLSLFGTRPKRTGQIIGIGAGVAITLTTLGVSALVFRGAVNTIFNAQAVSQRLAELEVQEKNLLQQVQGLEAQKAETQLALEEAQAKINNAESQQQAAETERDNALKEVTALETQQTTLEANAKKLQTDLQALQTQLRTASSELEEATSGLAEAKDELSTANEQRQDALAEAEGAKAAATQAVTEVAALKSQIEVVEQDLGTKTTELAEQTQALEAARENLQTAQASVQAAEQELAEAQGAKAVALRERDAAQAQVTTLQESQTVVEAALQTIQRQVDDYERQAADLRVLNESLAAKNGELLEESATLNAANDNLEEQNRDLTNSNDILNTQAQSLKTQVLALNQQLEEQATELSAVQEQIRATNSGELTYNINEVVHSGVVSSQDPIEIRSELAQLFSAANNKTVQRRAGPIEPRTEQLEVLVQAISESPNSDIVTLRSPYNQFGGAPVSVDVEAIENQLLVGRGQLVVARQIHLGSELPVTSEEVNNKVRDLLRDANDKLLSLGLADNVDTTTPDGSSLSPEAFSSDLERLTGVVTIGLVATEEVMSSGPVKLSLVIIN
jgi:uncharacterized protein (DUF3084 family)